MRKAVFDINGEFTSEGYTNDQHWNGWACPYFTKEVGLKLAETMSDVTMDLTFNEEQNTFVAQYYSGCALEDDIEIFEGSLHDVDGVPTMLYPIGAWTWVWQEQRDEEPEVKPVKVEIVDPDNGCIEVRDVNSGRVYNLTYNTGIDIVLITEWVVSDEEDCFELIRLVDYFHGNLDAKDLLESAAYYIAKDREV